MIARALPIAYNATFSKRHGLFFLTLMQAKLSTMDTRTAAREWLKSKHRLSSQAMYTSKYYEAFESWPKKEVWWLQIPIIAVEQYTHINLLCQASPESQKFFFLKVPSSFFKEHLSKFDIVRDKIHIYLSPDPVNFLTEIRGKGALKFGSFLISK
jgi:hypothetical protein